jgi:hypothetical protein
MIVACDPDLTIVVPVGYDGCIDGNGDQNHHWITPWFLAQQEL